MTKQDIIKGPEELMPSYRRKLVQMIILGKYPKAEGITFCLFDRVWVVSFYYEWSLVIVKTGVRVYGDTTYYNLYISDVEGYDLEKDVDIQYNTKRFKQK